MFGVAVVAVDAMGVGAGVGAGVGVAAAIAAIAGAVAAAAVGGTFSAVLFYLLFLVTREARGRSEVIFGLNAPCGNRACKRKFRQQYKYALTSRPSLPSSAQRLEKLELLAAGNKNKSRGASPTS